MILVAGVGNIFLGDDAFGVEVVRRLSKQDLPSWARVVDYGIRGMHLAHDMANASYPATILIDAVDRDDPPGTLSVIELDTAAMDEVSSLDAHGMQPELVLGLVGLLGAKPGRVLLLGCQPQSLDEHMGLSPPVNAAVGAAVVVAQDLIADLWKELACAWVSQGK
ncbi:hydrogenase maturation protease [Kibdelosporangium philippinense]|uniref:Hydrogenase maturation protease n=1 Tax=Kibdelosporangium philippinense TaxID=211113 RepID=A0ABS8ZHK0_9PSEU|nr:hydrogenase maturation protease [Kibdelosporangium philippinense]MCE7006834.1 hydrogenase maturation protease [Kibdelosporangium philippinense]